MNEKPAIDRALNDIHQFEREGYIGAQMAQRARDVVGLLFQRDTIYCSIAPDDGGVTFYWRAGDRSISIDLYPEGGCWQCVRNGESRQIWDTGGIRRELWDALADFSAYVESANPDWRLQTP